MTIPSRGAKGWCKTLLVALFCVAICGEARAADAGTASSIATPTQQIGIASWYGNREAGHRTASGTIFDPSQATAANRTLPLGTCVRVTHLGNGRAVVVPITDRGPYVRGRLIDLSEMAAQMLGMKQTGLAQVRMDVVASCSNLVKTPPVTRL